jgi:hypothetical protein
VVTFYHSIDLHSNIIKTLGKLARVWYWLRYKNRKTGSGRVHFNINELAAAFRVKYDTACRWLLEMERKGYVQQITRSCSTVKGKPDSKGLSPGEVICDLLSRDKLCLLRKLDSYGTVAAVPVTRLLDLRIALFDIVTMQKQRSSVFLARKEAKTKKTRAINIVTNAALYVQQVTPKGKRKKKVRSAKGKEKSCLQSRRRNPLILFTTETHIFLSRFAKMTGASLAGISKEIDRCIRTIKRYSSAKYREKMGSPKIRKKQQFQEVKPDRLDKINGLGGIFIERPGRYYKDGKVYQAGCNLYDLVENPYEEGKPIAVEQVHLKTCRVARWKYKRLVAQELAKPTAEGKHSPNLLQEIV